MNQPNLPADQLKIWLSVAGVVVMLLCLFWPRNIVGRVVRTELLLITGLLLMGLVFAPSFLLKRQNDLAVAAEMQHLRNSNVNVQVQLTETLGNLRASNLELVALRHSASEDRRLAAERQAALEQHLSAIASRAQMVGRTLQLEFNDSLVTFETAKKELICDSKEKLSKVVGFLSRDLAGIEKITIIGHTDLTGSPQFNEQLAVDRAQEVRKYLENSGIPAELLAQAEGRSFRQPFGYAEPQSDDVIARANATKEQKAKNRRVQMNILQIKVSR